MFFTSRSVLIVYIRLLPHAVSDSVKRQYEDNCKWIKEASQHQLVSGRVREGRERERGGGRGERERGGGRGEREREREREGEGEGRVREREREREGEGGDEREREDLEYYDIFVLTSYCFLEPLLLLLHPLTPPSNPTHQVVGSQARILYSNEEGRVAIALAFNQAVADGRLKVHTQTYIVFSGTCVLDIVH